MPSNLDLAGAGGGRLSAGTRFSRSPYRASDLDRHLEFAVRLVAAVLFVALAGFLAFYVTQRYVHPSESLADRDLRDVEAQVRANPDEPELRVALANLYLEKGLVAQGADQAEQVLRLRPGHVPAALALASARAQQNQQDLAIETLASVAALNRDNPLARASLQGAALQTALARLYLDAGRPSEAVAAAEAAAEIDRGDADALYLLGRALAADGQQEAALAAYQRALRLVPSFPEVYAELVRIYDQRGDRPGGLFAWGMVRYSTGELEQALDPLRQAAQAQPDAANPRLGLGMTLEKLGRPAEALDEYRRAVALDPTLYAARQAVGRLEARP